VVRLTWDEAQGLKKPSTKREDEVAGFTLVTPEDLIALYESNPKKLASGLTAYLDPKVRDNFLKAVLGRSETRANFNELDALIKSDKIREIPFREGEHNPDRNLQKGDIVRFEGGSLALVTSARLFDRHAGDEDAIPEYVKEMDLTFFPNSSTRLT